MLGLGAHKYIGQLQKLQNRAARVITGSFIRSTPSHLTINNLGWLNVTNRHNIFIHKCAGKDPVRCVMFPVVCLNLPADDITDTMWVCFLCRQMPAQIKEICWMLEDVV